MGKAECLNNIKKEDPPVYCGDTLCGRIQGKINNYCKHNGLGGDVPVPQSPESGDCWCCCSCLAWGTPIEVETDLYMPIEKIERGRTVLATGGKMASWESIAVTDVGGVAPGTELDFCYTAVFRLSDQTMRILISTADHLYLLPDQTLKAVQDLRPGDRVMQADGGQATVTVISSGQFSGGVRNFSLGEFNPATHPDDPYKGHLINSFGLVTADLAVQMAFYANAIPPRLLAEDQPELPQIGSARFYEKYDTSAYDAFICTPEMWPEGFVPVQPSLFNIPFSALAYFTREQAEDLQTAEGEQNLGNSQAMANFKYVRTLFRGFYPKYFYAADWSNQLPNAWYFNSAGQPYIVFSGGLLRMKTLDTNGLAMIASHLVAQASGYGCAGTADYWGAALILREVWYGRLYLDLFPKAMTQISNTFGLVAPEHAEPDPNNLCKAPGLACRLLALQAASSFDDIPECVSGPSTFSVTGASATLDPAQTVRVDFSSKVVPSTAAPPANYRISGDVVVLQAQPSADEKSVMLSVNGLLPATTYTVEVSNVVSATGQFLADDKDSADFRTP